MFYLFRRKRRSKLRKRRKPKKTSRLKKSSNPRPNLNKSPNPRKLSRLVQKRPSNIQSRIHYSVKPRVRLRLRLASKTARLWNKRKLKTKSSTPFLLQSFRTCMVPRRKTRWQRFLKKDRTPGPWLSWTPPSPKNCRKIKNNLK